jgi:hypothetical protein
MAKRQPLTDREKEEIAHLREDLGWSVAAIARKIGCSHGSVAWALLAMGAEKPGHETKPLPPIPTAPVVAVRNGHVVRRFTVSDDEFILARAAEGLPACRIGKLMTPPRRPNSITARMRTIGRRQAREEARAALLGAAVQTGAIP